MIVDGVSFNIDGSQQLPVAITFNAGQSISQTTFQTSTLSAGSHVMSATFHGAGIGGDSYDPSTSDPITQQVNMSSSSTSTTLQSSKNPSIFGQNVIFTAEVTLAQASNSGSGGTSVIFTVDGNPQPAVPLTFNEGDSTSLATYQTNSLSVGSHIVLAKFSGGTIGGHTYVSSTSEPLTQEVKNHTHIICLLGILCLIFNSRILMSDGSTKPIQDLRAGDLVAGDPNVNTIYKVAKLRIYKIGDLLPILLNTSASEYAVYNLKLDTAGSFVAEGVVLNG